MNNNNYNNNSKSKAEKLLQVINNHKDAALTAYFLAWFMARTHLNYTYTQANTYTSICACVNIHIYSF